MKTDVTNAEGTFAAFQSGVTTFVMNAFANYEGQLAETLKVIEKQKEQIANLQKELQNKESCENKEEVKE